MLETLKQLALMNAIREVIRVNSRELAKRINQSHQTAARKLKELEDKGLIERRITKDGQYIIITEKGKNLLYKEYIDYKRIFEEKSPKTIVIKGSIFTGIGEGRYYVSLDGYRKQFIEKLGFDPYPGTLNLKLSKDQLPLKLELDKKEGITINGFKSESRTFGAVKAFKCKIRNLEGAVVLPERTHYSNVIEIIAPVSLRKELGLKDGDIVEVEIMI